MHDPSVFVDAHEPARLRVEHAVRVTSDRWVRRRATDVEQWGEQGAALTRRQAWRWSLSLLVTHPSVVYTRMERVAGAVMVALIVLAGFNTDAVWAGRTLVGLTMVVCLSLVLTWHRTAADLRVYFDGLGDAPVLLAYAQHTIALAPRLWRAPEAMVLLGSTLRAAVLRLGRERVSLLVAQKWSTGILDPRALLRVADAVDTVDITLGPDAADDFFDQVLSSTFLFQDPGAAAWLLASTGSRDAFLAALQGGLDFSGPLTR